MKAAISKINKNGILLVFPVNNSKEPHSLWSEMYPRTKMLWEWDSMGDNKVAGMWSLMKKLSDCEQVVYSKWYQGRATFFSRDLFRALLCVFLKSQNLARDLTLGLREESSLLLEILEQDSPLSTKQLKKMAELQGRDNEPLYTKATKELFQRFLIVAYGEVDDGAFPSLAMGATRLLYEGLWNEALKLSHQEAMATINKFMPPGSSFRKHFEKNLKLLS